MRSRAVDKLYRRINQLFAETLKGGVDSDRPWDSVRRLSTTGSDLVFERAKSWSSSRVPLKRARAASILSQLRRPITPRPKSGSISIPVFKNESFDLVQAMIQQEQNPYALRSQIFAFGHLDRLEAVPLVLPYVDHSDEEIRYACAFALGSLHSHPDSTGALVKLADDQDQDVRNWAIFGVGVLGGADSEELRQLFLAHIEDPFLDARIEAAASLAKRHDARLAAPLVRLFKTDGPLSGLLEAARDLLEMNDDPPDWYAKDYIFALEAKFLKQVNQTAAQQTITSR